MLKKSIIGAASVALAMALAPSAASAQASTTTTTTTTGNTGGALTGAAGGAAVEPPTTVRTYVTENRVEPVMVQEQVVVGTAMPETVVLHSVPDYEYEYTYVNGQPVLVDPATRKIVYVYE